MSKSISLINVSKNFRGKKALEEVSFEVEAGEIMALLGSNGAGKTTTLNLITGFLAPSSGKIEIHGLDHSSSHTTIKAQIGYLTSGMALYEKFSLKEVLHYFGGLHQMKKNVIDNRIEEMAEWLDFTEVINKRFPNMSSGQKQKALISTCLLHDPDILIFDEVTASLDVMAARSIMDFLIHQKTLGKTVLFSTHILSEAEYISDRMAILHDGKLLEVTTGKELMDKHGVTSLTDAFYQTFEPLEKLKKSA